MEKFLNNNFNLNRQHQYPSNVIKFQAIERFSCSRNFRDR